MSVFVRLIILASLCAVGSAADCFGASTWPKLVGWMSGGVTEVNQIDYCSARDEVALGLNSDEAKLRGNIKTFDLNDVYIVMVQHVSTETYKWAKVIEKVGINSSATSVVKFTPDCTKILLAFWKDGSGPNYIYFDPATGTHLGTAKTAIKSPYLTGKDSVSMTSDGSTIFSIAFDEEKYVARMFRMTYSAGKFNLQAIVSWYLDDTSVIKRLTIQNHKTKVISLSSSKQDEAIPVTRSRCRTDIWPADFATNSNPERSRAATQDTEITCSHPQVLSLSSPGPGGASMVLMQVFNYLIWFKHGVLRTYLNSDYSFSENLDKMHFTNSLRVEIRSVLYVDQNIVYAMAYDQNQVDTLIKYDLSASASEAIKYWQFYAINTKKGSSIVGHLDSVITGLNTDSRNLPVKGFKAASSRLLRAYNNFCDGGDLYKFNDYNMIYWTNDSVSMFGAFDRIELDTRSCAKERTSVVRSSEGKQGTGRNLDETSYVPFIESFKFENLPETSQIIHDYTAAGTDPSMQLGDWESATADLYERCNKVTSLLDEVSFVTVPKLITQGPVYYIIGSGPVTIQWDDTWTSDTGCSVNLKEYKLGESTSSGQSSNLGLNVPQVGQTQFSVQTSDPSLHFIEHKVSLLPLSSSLQCVKLEITVIPLMCEKDIILSAQWGNLGSNHAGISHQIAGETSVLLLGQVKNNLELHCPQLYYLLEQETSPGNWEPSTSSIVTFDQAKLEVTVQTTIVDIQLAGSDQKFRLVITSVNDPSTAATPGYATFTVNFGSPCTGVALIAEYGTLKSEELSEKRAVLPFPGVQYLPEPTAECGSVRFKLVFSTKTPINDFIQVSSSGEVNLEPLPEGTAGVHSVIVKVWLEDYPDAQAWQTVQVEVLPCTPAKLLAPADHPGKVEYIIGSSEMVLKFYQFTIAPYCSNPQLDLQVLYRNSTALSSEFRVSIGSDQQSLIINTRNKTLAGTHQLQVRASTISSSLLIASFEFKLELIWIDPTSFLDQFASDEEARDGQDDLSGFIFEADDIDPSDVVIAINRTGSIDFKLPKSQAKYQVEMGDSGRYFIFNSKTASIQKIEDSEDLPFGVYSIKVSNAVSQKSQTYSVIFLVSSLAKTSTLEVESKVDLKLKEMFAQPRISSISEYGELVIKWNKPMVIQDHDQSTYDQLMKKRTLTKNITTGELVESQAIYIEYLASYLHDNEPKMKWTFKEWQGNQRSVFQLSFDKPELVAMEQTYDNIQITFNNPLLFQANDKSFVSQSSKISKTIGTQIPDGVLAETLVASGEAATDSMKGIGFSTFAVSFSKRLSLKHLWSMVNSLQLAVNLPILKVQFPGIANTVYREIHTLTNLQMFDIQNQVVSLYNLDEDEEAYSLQFERMGFDSQNFIAQCGLFLPNILSVIPIIVLYQALKLLKRLCPKLINRMLSKYRDNFFWNFYLRLILESSLDIGVLAMMDIHILNLSNAGYIQSFTFAIASIGFLFAMLLWIRLWLRKQDLENEILGQRVGTVFDGLKHDKRALITQEWFIIRRVIFAASAFFAIDHIWLSLGVIQTCTILSVIINLQKPFESSLSYKVEQINELFLLFFQYHLLTFTNFVRLAETRVMMGTSLMFATLLNILINLLINLAVMSVAVKLQIKTLYQKLKQRCSKKPHETMKKESKFNQEVSSSQSSVKEEAEKEQKISRQQHLLMLSGSRKRSLNKNIASVHQSQEQLHDIFNLSENENSSPMMKSVVSQHSSAQPTVRVVMQAASAPKELESNNESMIGDLAGQYDQSDQAQPALDQEKDWLDSLYEAVRHVQPENDNKQVDDALLEASKLDISIDDFQSSFKMPDEGKDRGDDREEQQSRSSLASEVISQTSDARSQQISLASDSSLKLQINQRQDLETKFRQMAGKDDWEDDMQELEAQLKNLPGNEDGHEELKED